MLQEEKAIPEDALGEKIQEGSASGSGSSMKGPGWVDGMENSFF